MASQSSKKQAEASNNSSNPVWDLHRALAATGNPETQPVVKAQAGGPQQPVRRCEQCRESSSESGEKLMRCSKCSLAFYCSKDCQKRHWKSTHKHECQGLQQQHAAGMSSPLPTPVPDGFKPISRNGIMLEEGEDGVVQAPAVPKGLQTESKHTGNAATFEWDINCWQHSKPAIFDSNLGCGCMQGEVSVCSIQPFDKTAGRSEVSVRILGESPDLGLGVCTKRKGQMDMFWKYIMSGEKFSSGTCMPASPYGRCYGRGDVVTVRLAGKKLEFDVNGQPQGVAFDGLKPSAGPYFLRAHLCNQPDMRNVIQMMAQVRAGASLESIQNVGPPSRSDPRGRRAEVLIISPPQ